MADNYYTMPWKETEYNGITYRSSLEAQWARFFTQLGVKFTYESKKFKIPELAGTPEFMYTPDFALLGCPYNYVEIKPKYPDSGTVLKCTSLSRQNVNVAIIYGQCRPDEFEIMFFEGGKEIVHRPKWLEFFKARRDRWADMRQLVDKRRGFVKAMGK